MRLKLIIVSPKFQMNVGYIARAAKNFGIERLHFVKPRADLKGKKAIMFAKHARDLLENAKVYRDFDEAILGCSAVVGTTGIWREIPQFEKEYLIEDAIKYLKKNYGKNSTIALVIGRDDRGLGREELEKCDVLAHIGSNPEYPILQIGHAVAIFLYLFSKENFKNYEPFKNEKSVLEEEKVLYRTFERMISKKPVRNRRGVRNIFGKMVRKAELNRHEMHALITALK